MLYEDNRRGCYIFLVNHLSHVLVFKIIIIVMIYFSDMNNYMVKVKLIVDIFSYKTIT